MCVRCRLFLGRTWARGVCCGARVVTTSGLEARNMDAALAVPPLCIGGPLSGVLSDEPLDCDVTMSDPLEVVKL